MEEFQNKVQHTVLQGVLSFNATVEGKERIMSSVMSNKYYEIAAYQEGVSARLAWTDWEGLSSRPTILKIDGEKTPNAVVEVYKDMIIEAYGLKYLRLRAASDRVDEIVVQVNLYNSVGITELVTTGYGFKISICS